MEIPRLVKIIIAVAPAGGRKVTDAVAVEVINEDLFGEVVIVIMGAILVRQIVPGLARGATKVAVSPAQHRPRSGLERSAHVDTDGQVPVPVAVQVGSVQPQ